MNADLVWSLLVKGSAILVVAAIAALALRRSSASSRHLVWLAAFVALLLLPFAQVRLPNWNVQVERAPLVAPLLAPAALQPIAQPSGKHTLFSVAPVFVPHAPAPQTPPFDYAAMILAVWIVGCTGFIAWGTFGLLMVALLVRTGRPSELFTVVGSQVIPGVRILVCPKLRVPATAGILRPAILLPEEAAYWDSERLRMVLAHEAAHIRRRDWVWQTVGQAARAIHFFNPLVWMALKQMRKESEQACDDFVLGLGFEADTYATALLDIARASRFQVANTVGMARSANVEGRLKSIIDSRRNRKWVSGKAALSVLAAVSLFVIPIAVVKALPHLNMPRGAAKDHQASGPMLPHIKWVRSKEVATNVFRAQKGIAGLRGGYSVKLIGIGTDGSPEIWGLDGKPLPDASLWAPGTGKYWRGNVFNRRNHDFNVGLAAFNRVFYIEVESDMDATPSVTFEMVDPVAKREDQQRNLLLAGGGEKMPEVPFLSHDPSFAAMQLCVPSRSDTGTVRLGITTGDWQTVADIRQPVQVTDAEISRVGRGDPKEGEQCMVSLDNDPTLWYMDRDMESHVVHLLQGEPLSPDTARRVLLYDKDGQSIDLGDHGSLMDGYPMYGISAKNFSRIARAVVQTTPYVWAEFKDVPLQPDFEKNAAARAAAHVASLESGVHGTATGIAPGFSKKLPGGVTVSLASVTRAIEDNNQWVFSGQPSWRGDGEVLSTRPDENGYPNPYSPKYPNPFVHFGINIDGLKAGADTIVRSTSQFDPQTHRPIFDGGGSWGLQAAPTDKVAAVHVGVANGLWKTVATQSIDMQEEPPVQSVDIQTDQKNQTRTGFEVVLGKTCYVREMATDTKVVLEGKSPDKYAMRVMVRLKTGELKNLGEAMSTAEGWVYPVPARQGEWTLRFSKVTASQVAAVELQARPYEFVEFNNVALQHRG